MATVIIQGTREAVVEVDVRRPAGQRAEAAVVGDEVADIDALPVGRKFALLESAAAIRPDQRLGQCEERIGLAAANVEREAGGIAAERGAQKRLDRIIDIQELAALLAPPYLEGGAFERPTQPDAEEILPCILDPHARSINIGQPQRAGVDSIGIVKQQVIGLAGHLVDAVDIGRPQRMLLVDRQIAWPAVDLPRPGMHDGDRRDHGPAQFQELQLRRAIDREVMLRRIHRIEMAGLAGEIEQEILAGKQVAQRGRIADIADIDPHPLAYVGDVGEIGAGLGDHAVDEQHLGAESHQTPRQRRPYEADAAGDDHMRPAEGGKTPIRILTHKPSPLLRTPMPAGNRLEARTGGERRYSGIRHRPDQSAMAVSGGGVLARGNSRSSTSPQTICPSVMWSCWISGVESAGAQRHRSQRAAMSPPPFPVKPMTTRPLARAAAIALRMFGERPEVESAISTSPGRPSPST